MSLRSRRLIALACWCLLALLALPAASDELDSPFRDLWDETGAPPRLLNDELGILLTSGAGPLDDFVLHTERRIPLEESPVNIEELPAPALSEASSGTSETPISPADKAKSEAKSADVAAGNPPAKSDSPQRFLTYWTESLPQPFRYWSGRAELGMNGTDGNSRQFSSHSVGKLQRKAPTDEITLSITHDFAKTRSKITANQLLYDGRFEALAQESPWTAYVHDTVEYNQFAAFDARVSFDGGLGYRWFNTEWTKFKTRVGAGASRKYGVPDSEFEPEGTVGAELEYKFWERHKITGKTEWFPSLDEWGEYRCLSEAAWETKLDAHHPLSMKLAVTDRYDSNPNGAKHNDIQYSALLVWEF